MKFEPVIATKGNRRAKAGRPAVPPTVMNRGERRKPLPSLCFELPHSFMNHRSGPIGGRRTAAFRGENRLHVATALPAGGTFTKRGQCLLGGSVDQSANPR
jgi:hypothetical protein